MSPSELGRLAASMRALSDQVLRDAPQLADRRRRIEQLAARATHLARQSNDQGLARVADLTRLAADRLDDAVNTLGTTADQGHTYADHLTGSGPTTAARGAGDGDSLPPSTAEATDTTNDEPEPSEGEGRKRRSGRKRRRPGWATKSKGSDGTRTKRQRGRYKTSWWGRIEDRLLNHIPVIAGTIGVTVKFGRNVWTFVTATITHAVFERMERKKRRREKK